MPLGTQAKEGVVLLYGLCRTSRSMERMEAAFASAGYAVVNLDYPSRRAPIGELARATIGPALADPRLQGYARVHFVAHSIGGVLRHALWDGF